MTFFSEESRFYFCHFDIKEPFSGKYFALSVNIAFIAELTSVLQVDYLHVLLILVLI